MISVSNLSLKLQSQLRDPYTFLYDGFVLGLYDLNLVIPTSLFPN